jgi:rhamnose transport system substrate-binding protein
MSPTQRRLFGLVATVALVAAACSSGGGSPSPSAAESTAASAPLASVAASVAPSASTAAGGAVVAEPGQSVKMLLLPKFTGVAVFDQANEGAQEANTELQNPEKVDYTGPDQASSAQGGQVEFVTNAPTQGYKALMISNNSGDQIAPAAKTAADGGIKVVTWDSPIPSAKGETVFVAQVDFDSIGVVMADMALSLIGPDGGEFGVLSASPDAANQNAWIAALKKALEDPKYAKIKLVETVYGDDVSEKSYNQALALVDNHKNLKVIMAPTTVGIAAAAKAMSDEKLCDKVKVSGLGLPSEMVSYTMSGCAPQFALWSFVDLGYLTYYTSYMIATGAIQGVEGETFEAGRLGPRTITKDPTRDAGLRILMGPFTVYDKTNVEAASK